MRFIFYITRLKEKVCPPFLRNYKQKNKSNLTMYYSANKTFQRQTYAHLKPRNLQRYIHVYTHQQENLSYRQMWVKEKHDT